jgi:hypothetical protein
VGAVRLDAEKIAEKSPPRYILYAIEEGIGAGETPYGFHVSMQAEASNSFWTRPAGEAADFYITESMESESGNVNFFPFASTDIDILLNRDFRGPWSSDGATVVTQPLDLSAHTCHGIEGSIWVKELSVA